MSCYKGVACAPEKLTLVDTLVRWRICAIRLDTNNMEVPESSNARAIICLPPGPLTNTWLVIMRLDGRVCGILLDDELALTATTFTTGGTTSVSTGHCQLQLHSPLLVCHAPYELMYGVCHHKTYTLLYFYNPHSDGLGPGNCNIVSYF